MARLIDEFSRSWLGGMHQRAATTYRRDQAALIRNGRVQADGTLKPRGGTKKTTNVQFGTARPGYFGDEFIPATGPRQWVVVVDNEGWISQNQGLDWFDVASETLLGADPLHRNYWSGTTYRQSAVNYLMLANGGDEVWEYDGTFTLDEDGLVESSGWVQNTNYPSGVKFIATFNDRVYFAGHDGNNVGASKVGDRNILAAPDGLQLAIQTHDGDHEITGLYQIKDLLVVYKRESTAYVDGYGNSDIIVATGPLGLSRSVGCVAHRTIQGAGEQGVLWLSERGVEHWIPGGPIRLVSEPLRPFFENDVNWSAIFGVPGMPTALYYPSRHQYWLWLPTGNSAQNNRAFIYDLRLGACALDDLPVESDQYTLNIDANGYLCLEKDTSGSKAVLVDGYLAIAETGDDGVYVDLASHNPVVFPEDETYLALPSNNTSPATLFSADRTGRPASPIGIGYDGFVRYMDEGETDNVATGINPLGYPGETPVDFRVRTRPMLFGMPFHRKRGRVVDVLATAPDAVPGTIVLIADGVETSLKELSIPASRGNRSQPRRVKVRVNGRGRTLQVEFRTEETLNLDGIRLAAEVLREVA